MKKKLFLLEEDEMIAAEEEKVIPSDEADVAALSATTMISSLIKGEWDAIDQYNSMIASFESMNETRYIDTLREIVSEEYIHVGQLEKLIQDVNPQADNIETGHNHDEEAHVELDSTEGV